MDLKQHSVVVKQFSVYRCTVIRKRTCNWNKLQKLTPVNVREKNLMSRWQQHNCFNKNEICIILKSFLTLTARKNFVFSSV